MEMPGFQWPANSVGRPVAVTGRLLKPRIVRGDAGREVRIDRIGEVEIAERWSR